MKRLGLELFIGGKQDLESAQYRILAALQDVRRAFDNNRIYPHLSELMEVHAMLHHVMQGSHRLNAALPKKIKSVDWANKRVVYEAMDHSEEQGLIFEDLIQWAMPQLKKVVEEGQTLCAFFDDHLDMDEVGIVPAYLDEGYLLVPDEQAEVIHVIKYGMSIFTGSDEQYRSLKTSLVKVVGRQEASASPYALKLWLMERFHDLPNPATFLCSTDLAVPFRQTLLPIAKRKLMRHIASC